LLDASSAESISSHFFVPPQWATAHIDLYWNNHSTGVGDVAWGIDYNAAASNGSTLTASVLGAAVTATAGAQDVVVVSRLVTGYGLTATTVQLLHIYRSAANAADTLANDAAVLGVLLTRAS
jgi:hypothetical protein